MSLHRVRSVAASAAAALLALQLGACGGGGSSSAPAVRATGTPQASPGANAGSVSVDLQFPGQGGGSGGGISSRATGGSAGSTSVTAAGKKRAKASWISPSANNATLFVDNNPVSGITHQSTSGNYTTSVNPGSHVFTLVYYDASNNALATGSATLVITSGNTTAATITLNGIPATVVLTTVPSFTQGSSGSGSVIVDARDADANIIGYHSAHPGIYAVPITLSVSQPGYTGAFSLTSGAQSNVTSVTVTAPQQTITMSYNGTTPTGIGGSSLTASAANAVSASSLVFGTGVTVLPVTTSYFARNQLSWVPCGGCTSYNIYRGTFPGQETTEIATGLSGTTYQDYSVTASYNYYYRMSAIVGTEKFDPTEVSSQPYSDPTRLATDVLWLDANDPSTVITSGSAVTAWIDKSGNVPANTVTQSNASYQPTVMTGSPASRTILRFNTANHQYMGDAAFSPSTLPALSLYTVHAVNSEQTWDALFSLNTPNAMNNNWSLDTGASIDSGNSGTTTAFNYRALEGALPIGTRNGTTNIRKNSTVFGTYVIEGDELSTTQADAYFNGTIEGTVASTAAGPIPSQSLLIACNQYGTTPCFIAQSTMRTGDESIGEMIAYSQVLPTAQRQMLEGYLAWKWGLQTYLPAGHPYKTGAP